jgi:hypothetical protein
MESLAEGRRSTAEDGGLAAKTKGEGWVNYVQEEQTPVGKNYCESSPELDSSASDGNPRDSRTPKKASNKAPIARHNG